jgi:putative oxidoreductase
VQRIFSNFADGWAGFGLLIQRIIAGASLVCYSLGNLFAVAPCCANRASQLIAVLCGILLLAGLWTPVIGVLAAFVEVWVAVANPGARGVPLLLAGFGATLAMIGPGAWSLDSLLFGRKRLELPDLGSSDIPKKF